MASSSIKTSVDAAAHLNGVLLESSFSKEHFGAQIKGYSHMSVIYLYVIHGRASVLVKCYTVNPCISEPYGTEPYSDMKKVQIM